MDERRFSVRGEMLGEINMGVTREYLTESVCGSSIVGMKSGPDLYVGRRTSCLSSLLGEVLKVFCSVV